MLLKGWVDGWMDEFDADALLAWMWTMSVVKLRNFKLG